MSTRSGACVARARLQARFGSPMPTNTTSPFASARAAVTAIISFGVYSEPIVHAGRHPSRRTQSVCKTRLRRDIRCTIADAVHELIEIARQPLGVARDRLPLDVERIVAVVVPVRVRWVRAPRLYDDGVDDHAWHGRAIRV